MELKFQYKVIPGILEMSEAELNVLGAEGWELATHVLATWYFKRRLAEPATGGENV